MLTYILRRLLLMIPTMIGITIVVTAIMLAAPGEPGQRQPGGPSAGPGGDMKLASSKAMLDAKKDMGFFDEEGEKLWFGHAWWNWVNKLVRLDFGKSFRFHVPVTELLAERIPVTLRLNLIALVLLYLLALPLGIFAATHRGTTSEGCLSTVLFVLYSLPAWWVATMFVVYFASVNFVDWFPVDGLHASGSERFTLLEYLGDSVHRLVLPITCMTYGGLAYLSRQMRAGMLEVVRQDYIRTARAKGLDERRVTYVHALRNAMIPIITLLSGLLPAMVGGSIIIELIFSIKGMGKLGFEAIFNRDYLVVMANTVVAAFLTLVGILISDVLYCLVDPRISLD